MSLDNLDRIVAKLQEVTDDIIRKKIIPRELEEESVRANFGSDSPVKGIPLEKQQLIAATGGNGNALLFPIIAEGLDTGPLDKVIEEMIGTFPLAKLLGQLDEPLKLDCELILQQYGFEDEDSEDEGEDDEAIKDSRARGNGTMPPEEDAEADDEDEEEEDEEDEGEDPEAGAKDCAEIELTWLKIILILVKVIKIFKIILDMILAILLPIIQIVMLAVGAWINPPNIVMIVQIIIELVVAIVVMLITMILQLIWNLLNLDCVCDMTASIIEQIQKALAAFASIAGAFDPTAIGLMIDKAAKEVIDPLQDVLDQMNKKKEDWAKFTQDMKDLVKPENLKALKDKMAKDIEAGIVAGVMADPKIQRVQQLYGQATKMVKTGLTAVKEAKKVVDNWKKAPENVIKPTKARWATMLSSPSFTGVSAVFKPKKDE